MNKYFLHQIKHVKGGDAFDKGVAVKDTLDAARQGYHAYLGAYAYGNSAETDYVQAEVTDMDGNRLLFEVWRAPQTPGEVA